MDNDNLLQICIFRNGHPAAYCKANYIGLLGMQLDVSPVVYPKGTQLEVELTINENEGEGNRQCRLPAVVTNHSNDSVGLTFLNHDMQNNSVLLDVILTQTLHDTVT